MKAVCPTNSEHNEFYANATVREEWKVAPDGNFIDRMGCVYTLKRPRADEVWTCVDCGAEAVITEGA